MRTVRGRASLFRIPGRSRLARNARVGTAAQRVWIMDQTYGSPGARSTSPLGTHLLRLARTSAGSSHRLERAQITLVLVAPTPRLAWLERQHQGMARLDEVPGGMLTG